MLVELQLLKFFLIERYKVLNTGKSIEKHINLS